MQHSILIPFEQIANLRDLGGMKTADGRQIRAGRLLRAGNLHRASQADAKRLSEMTALVIDLRTQREAAEQPDPELPAAEHLLLPIVEEVVTGMTHDDESERRSMELLLQEPEAARAHMMQIYGDFITLPFAVAQYEKFLRLLSEERSGAVLWHCTAGKDRTGFGALLIEEILGVPREAIFADYLYTNECLTGEIASIRRMLEKNSGQPLTASQKEATEALFGAHRVYLAETYRTAGREYGGMDAFIRDALHVSEEDRRRLRELYLEP